MTESVQEISSGISSYVAIDLETTGLDPKSDRIIEIGAVRVRDGKIEAEFSSMVNPGRKLSARITELTGITDNMVSDAPEMGSLITEVLDFCKDLPILGHHVIFDYSFLKRAAVNLGYGFERTGIDTLALCRRFMPANEKKNLSAACAYFGVTSEHAHRALSDAKMAHFLYQSIIYANPDIPAVEFSGKQLIYKVKKEQPASKKQKEGLRDLAKYHKINLSVQEDSLTRNEISRMIDQIIFQYGRIGDKNVKL